MENEEQTFQDILLRKLLEPSDTKLVLEPGANISVMELIINKLLEALKTVENGEDHIGLFECVFKTAFGLPDQTKYLKYEVAELTPIVKEALDIINRKEL